LAGAEADRPGIVHRLDKETSGVIVAARNEKALRDLMAQFENRTVRKMYLALVHGAPPDEFTVEAPIGRHVTQRALMAIQPPGQGRGSVTHFRTLARFTEPPALAALANHAGGTKNQPPAVFALVACYPKTGRTHQLRVHLKSVDCPILADGMYGPASEYPAKTGHHAKARHSENSKVPDPSAAPAVPLIDRQALHAYAIAFDHPTTAQRLRFVAHVPADMAAVLDAWSAGTTPPTDWRALIANLTQAM
ncbi:MAG TPA: RluA family pseudouridine synthase, partial [Planctomycetota bacterium]|nr:RluA family pseudouridine synthase [Planctomycetota bacterium]